ncbi:MAG: single-stranded DNA-binding protein [Spirochaetaceae bacterium]|jgi:single-strand DNA-binding protein|nr:single-stranded DNA-binding protein [Spirochaetaceae bacterium]
MADVNSVHVSGRLARDAQLKYLNNGDGVIEFSIAVNRSKKTANGWEDEASFFDVTHFTKSDSLAGKLVKGKWVVVDGSLKQNMWQDKDGNGRSKVVIMASRVHIPPVSNAQSEVSETTGYQGFNTGRYGSDS